MGIVELGFVVSVVLLIILFILFSYEAERGERFAESYRARGDFFVLKCVFTAKRSLRLIEKDTVRQTIHYFLHRLLNRFIACTKWTEEKLRRVVHVNKKLAKNAERESATRTKLEELTLHKAATTLSEQEKKKRKEKSLRGL